MGWFTKSKNDDEERRKDESFNDEDSNNPPPVISSNNVNNNNNGNNSGSRVRYGCCKRFCSEINPCQSWFLVQDPNGLIIDIGESFAPSSCYIFCWKIIFFAIAFFTLVYCIIKTTTPSFYYAYLTNWGVAFCNIYAFISFINTVLASRTPQPQYTCGFRIRFTWIMFNLAAQISFVATVVFWPVIYDPDIWDINYQTVVPHGILFIIVLFDGMVMNRIPIRLQHYIINFIVGIIYSVWTYIHSITDIGNPNKTDNDPETNDDAIYTVIAWNDDIEKALIWICIVALVVSPICYFLLWLLSIGFCCCGCIDTRRYIQDGNDNNNNNNDNRPTVDDVEEGSIFAKWS